MCALKQCGVHTAVAVCMTCMKRLARCAFTHIGAYGNRCDTADTSKMSSLLMVGQNNILLPPVIDGGRPRINTKNQSIVDKHLVASKVAHASSGIRSTG